MEDERIKWDSKIAVITTRSHNTGAMIPIDENIYQLSIAMVLRRHSYFTRRFNEVIHQLFDNGYISKLNLSFKKANQIKGISSGLLTLHDVVGLFRICFCGYVLALAVFGCEIVSSIFQQKQRSKKTLQNTVHKKKTQRKLVFFTRDRLI